MPRTECQRAQYLKLGLKHKAKWEFRGGVPFWEPLTILYKKSCNAFWQICVYSYGPVVTVGHALAWGIRFWIMLTANR